MPRKRRQPLYERQLEDEYGLSIGDDVEVDWSRGMGGRSSILGTIEDAWKDHKGRLSVGVRDYGTGDFDSGGSLDAAPEWLRRVELERPVPARPQRRRGDDGDLVVTWSPRHEDGSYGDSRTSNLRGVGHEATKAEIRQYLANKSTNLGKNNIIIESVRRQ